eukprot:357195-Amphidinium_carterae.1
MITNRHVPGVTGKMPSAWCPGAPMERTKEEVLAAVPTEGAEGGAAAEGAEAVELDEDVAEEAVEGPVTSAKTKAQEEMVTILVADDQVLEGGTSRQQLLPDAHITVLSEYVAHVCEKLPVNSPVLTVVFNEHLKNMGLKVSDALHWGAKVVHPNPLRGQFRQNTLDDLPGIFFDATDKHRQSTTLLYNVVVWMDTQINV